MGHAHVLGHHWGNHKPPLTIRGGGLVFASVHAYAWEPRWRPILSYVSASLRPFLVDEIILQDTRPLTTHMAIPKCNGKETLVSEHSGRHAANTMSRTYRVQSIGANSLHVQMPTRRCTNNRGESTEEDSPALMGRVRCPRASPYRETQGQSIPRSRGLDSHPLEVDGPKDNTGNPASAFQPQLGTKSFHRQERVSAAHQSRS